MLWLRWWKDLPATKEQIKSQAQLAHILEVTPTAVTDWLKNKRYPDAEALLRISRLLGVGIDSLIGGPPPTEPDEPPPRWALLSARPGERKSGG